MIEGASGVGKSDLALRLIDRGAVLVSDDYSFIRRHEGRILASAPATIAGKIEVRGLGIVETRCAGETPVALIVALGEPAARLPEPGDGRTVLGVELPFIALDGREASAAIKVEMALTHFEKPR